MGWVNGTVIARTDWAEGLFTLRLEASLEPFEPGQWINLGMRLEDDAPIVKRSYSIASAPGRPLELYLVRVDGGQITPRLDALRVGDEVLVQSEAQGFFTLGEVPDAQDLWLMATGTGLGPYLSMLRSGQIWPRFERVLLVHGVRYAHHLGYREELEALQEARPGFRYLPLVTREDDDVALRGRIPAAIDSGILEKAAGLTLHPDRSHVLLCGNPDMIGDTTAALSARGLRKHRRRRPGHISTEKYW